MMTPWFTDAKLGIFIHWGIYAVNGIPESWSMKNGEISREDYMRQFDGFTADKYDPKQWAELFKKAGARYAILTTKHHDGVALWDTRLSDLNVVQRSPAKRDLVKPFCQALRKAGIKVGLYFSHLDWSHPDYPSMYHTGIEDKYRKDAWDYPPEKEDPKRWKRFFRFHRGQLAELFTNNGKVDIIWFDGDWSRDGTVWKMKELRDELHGHNPQVVINSRMRGQGADRHYGDYETPEQAMPVEAPEGPWEFCMTLNDSWGYQPKDRNYKTLPQIIRIFCECIAMGGNLLLDVGPKADGTIPPEQVALLEGLGEWTGKHAEAIYGSRAGLPWGHFYGPSTLSKDGRTIYLFLFDDPKKEIAVKGLFNQVKSASVVGQEKELKHRVLGGAPWAGVPGMLWVEVPKSQLDRHVTVVKLELDKPMELYRGHGKVITAN